MNTRLTAKLFHTVVVLGVSMTAGCSDDSPAPTPGTSTSSTSGALADGGGVTTQPSNPGTSTSSSGTDALPGWVCCG